MDPTIRPATGSYASREDVMRTTLFTMAAALLLSTASAQELPQPAQEATPERPFLNQVDFGVRATTYAPGSDEARFQRYRDIRDGLTFDKFRFLSEKPGALINLRSEERRVGKECRYRGGPKNHNRR